MNEFFRRPLEQALQHAATALPGLLLVLLFIGGPVLLALVLLIRRSGARIQLQLHWQDRAAEAPRAAPDLEMRAQTPAAPTATGADPRPLLRTLYRWLVTLSAIALLIAAIAAWRFATPGNGLLPAFILGGLSLLAFLSIDKLDRQERAARDYREIWEGLRRNLRVQTVHAKPTLHFIDQAGIARARELQRSGAALDAICRAVAPDYGGWSSQEQEAFQSVMQAVLERPEQRS